MEIEDFELLFNDLPDSSAVNNATVISNKNSNTIDIWLDNGMKIVIDPNSVVELNKSPFCTGQKYD